MAVVIERVLEEVCTLGLGKAVGNRLAVTAKVKGQLRMGAALPERNEAIPSLKPRLSAEVAE